MSQQIAEAARTNNQPNGVSKKRNWTAIVISSLFGGVVAIVAAPTITALMPLGALGFIAGTTTTGVLGSIVTRVTGNAIDASSITLTIYQYPAQQFYRKTVIEYIGTTLHSVLYCLRTNTPFNYRSRVYFDIGDGFRFEGLDAKERYRMFFEFSFRVIPKEGTQPRSLNDSIPPPNLPNYNRDAARTLVTGDNKGLLDGAGWAVAEGVLFGIVGGALPKVFPALGRSAVISTVPGKVNVIVGLSSITGIAGPVKNLAFPSAELDKAALFVEFATETQCHVNRLIQCAAENGVGLELDMKIGSTTNLEATLAQTDTAGSQNQSFYWSATANV